jgi:hypothetical protein
MVVFTSMIKPMIDGMLAEVMDRDNGKIESIKNDFNIVSFVPATNEHPLGTYQYLYFFSYEVNDGAKANEPAKDSGDGSQESVQD